MRLAIVRCPKRLCRHQFESLWPEPSDGQIHIDRSCPACGRRIGQGIFVRWADEREEPPKVPVAELEERKPRSAASGLRWSDFKQGGTES